MRYGRELPDYPFNARALFTRGIIFAQQRLYGRWFPRLGRMAPLRYDCVGASANAAIRNLLLNDGPCMIARFGSGEMEATLRYWDLSSAGTFAEKGLRLLAGRIGPFWWDNSIRAGISWNAGLFPPTEEAMARFGARMLADCRAMDLLAGWLPGETRLHDAFFPSAVCVPLPTLEPFTFDQPWSAALSGKTVLAVHPFEATILQQYARRERLFENPDVLPPFRLKTYRTVQSQAGAPTPFPTWFDALEAMCRDISRIDFDIALIGAGAYGMPLAAHIKRMGKKAVHMGGATQLLFGIKGGRWDRLPAYAQTLYNDAWSRPLPEDRLPNCETIENGCYW